MTKTKALLAMIAAFVFFLGLGVWGGVSLLNQIQSGRRAGTSVVCAALSAVSQAGRDVITAGSKGPDTPFIRKLERLGYPTQKQRQAAAETAANSYVAGIAMRVEESTGGRGVNLVKSDGTIDCQAFMRLANAKGSP
jgi:hypothetical protein